MLDPKNTAAISVDDLQAGDLIRYNGELAMVCKRTNGGRKLTNVILTRAQKTLVVTSDSLDPELTVRIWPKPDLRIRLVSPALEIPRVKQSIGMLGIDANGSFACARHMNLGVDVFFAIELGDFEVDRDNEQSRNGGRIDLCRSWYSNWQLVLVDQWGREHVIFDLPFREEANQ